MEEEDLDCVSPQLRVINFDNKLARHNYDDVIVVEENVKEVSPSPSSNESKCFPSPPTTCFPSRPPRRYSRYSRYRSRSPPLRRTASPPYRRQRSPSPRKYRSPSHRENNKIKNRAMRSLGSPGRRSPHRRSTPKPPTRPRSPSVSEWESDTDEELEQEAAKEQKDYMAPSGDNREKGPVEFLKLDATAEVYEFSQFLNDFEGQKKKNKPIKMDQPVAEKKMVDGKKLRKKVKKVRASPLSRCSSGRMGGECREGPGERRDAGAKYFNPARMGSGSPSRKRPAPPRSKSPDTRRQMTSGRRTLETTSSKAKEKRPAGEPKENADDRKEREEWGYSGKPTKHLSPEQKVLEVRRRKFEGHNSGTMKEANTKISLKRSTSTPTVATEQARKRWSGSREEDPMSSRTGRRREEDPMFNPRRNDELEDERNKAPGRWEEQEAEGDAKADEELTDLRVRLNKKEQEGYVTDLRVGLNKKKQMGASKANQQMSSNKKNILSAEELVQIANKTILNFNPDKNLKEGTSSESKSRGRKPDQKSISMDNDLCTTLCNTERVEDQQVSNRTLKKQKEAELDQEILLLEEERETYLQKERTFAKLRFADMELLNQAKDLSEYTIWKRKNGIKCLQDEEKNMEYKRIEVSKKIIELCNRKTILENIQKPREDVGIRKSLAANNKGDSFSLVYHGTRQERQNLEKQRKKDQRFESESYHMSRSQSEEKASPHEEAFFTDMERLTNSSNFAEEARKLLEAPLSTLKVCQTSNYEPGYPASTPILTETVLIPDLTHSPPDLSLLDQSKFQTNILVKDGQQNTMFENQNYSKNMLHEPCSTKKEIYYDPSETVCTKALGASQPEKDPKSKPSAASLNTAEGEEFTKTIKKESGKVKISDILSDMKHWEIAQHIEDVKHGISIPMQIKTDSDYFEPIDQKEYNADESKETCIVCNKKTTRTEEQETKRSLFKSKIPSLDFVEPDIGSFVDMYLDFKESRLEEGQEEEGDELLLQVSLMGCESIEELMSPLTPPRTSSKFWKESHSHKDWMNIFEERYPIIKTGTITEFNLILKILLFSSRNSSSTTSNYSELLAKPDRVSEKQTLEVISEQESNLHTEEDTKVVNEPLSEQKSETFSVLLGHQIPEPVTELLEPDKLTQENELFVKKSPQQSFKLSDDTLIERAFNNLSSPKSTTTTETDISIKEQPELIPQRSEKPAPNTKHQTRLEGETASKIQSKEGLELGSELLEEKAFGSNSGHIETELGAESGVGSLANCLSETSKADAVDAGKQWIEAKLVVVPGATTNKRVHYMEHGTWHKTNCLQFFQRAAECDEAGQELGDSASLDHSDCRGDKSRGLGRHRPSNPNERSNELTERQAGKTYAENKMKSVVLKKFPCQEKMLLQQ